jgi:hypothetical protein
MGLGTKNDCAHEGQQEIVLSEITHKLAKWAARFGVGGDVLNVK